LHLLVRETRLLDEEEAAVDLGQARADLVFLSFSDSDLGAAATAWRAMGAQRPSLRLANLARLRHPMSVDLYTEQVVAHARCVVVRMLGGLIYWRYGAEELAALCRQRGIALAIMSGDESHDARLTELSTVPIDELSRLAVYLGHGGPDNVAQALRLAARLGGLGDGPTQPPIQLPRAGQHKLPFPEENVAGSALIVFYRSHLLAGDIAPIEVLAEALAARRLGVRAIYIASLKDAEAATHVVYCLRRWRPSVVLNMTGFSARQDDVASPLEAAEAPILQLVLAGTSHEAWQASTRGLSQTDLAMQVVLPELDGRLLTTTIAFKADDARVVELDFARTVFQPDPDGIAVSADRAAGWARLAATPRAERRIAVLLSDYPGVGGGQVGHAIGLDSLASLEEIAYRLGDAGYVVRDSSDLVERLCHAEPTPILPLQQYDRLFGALPEVARCAVIEAWGNPTDDPAVSNGAFTLRHAMLGHLVIAVQPDRGSALDRKATYHDPTLPPRHAYIAFYLWLREVIGIHALVHLGAHGTLEWLPGKAVALSATCFPAMLIGRLPVIYPFIVNNPGEAAAAKRRLGAVTIGHLTPPLKVAGSHGPAIELERLIDEFAAADGLDRRRTALLRREILDRAAETGLLVESGAACDATDDEALARLDAYLCDVKALQIRDGLHVFGRSLSRERRTAFLDAMRAASPGVSARQLAAGLEISPPSETAALLAALDGRFVAPGPAGAPTRGRVDVLPTGRNLSAVDPRAIPTRSAVVLAERAAEDLLRRHLQDQGDWPRSLVIDLWGSTTMRTGGEDLALALVLLGARPIWDEGSARVTGIEVLPLAVIDRPRVDVTLRISGLFRDAFEAQVMLFDAAVRAIAARDEDAAWNPLAMATRGLEGDALRHSTARVFGAQFGTYGAGVTHLIERGEWRQRDELGASYLAASAFAYGRDLDGAPAADGFAARVAAADAFVHQQDHRESDLLEGAEFAAHEGGFAAAANGLGNAPALYHLDTSQPERPRTRTLIEELHRVVRGRAANPAWIAGMMRHGYRGAAEIARSLDGLVGFAAVLPQRLDQQFDLLFDATLGDPTVDAFLQGINPAARAAMVTRFRDAAARDLWRPRRNAVNEILGSDCA
jgi:cobaltochelatase CobN